MNAMASTLTDPLFNGEDLSRLAHANDRWLRKVFKSYGSSPMAFRKAMKLAMVAKHVHHHQGDPAMGSTKQIAERFGFTSSKQLLTQYRDHFGASLVDVINKQMSLF